MQILWVLDLCLSYITTTVRATSSHVGSKHTSYKLQPSL